VADKLAELLTEGRSGFGRAIEICRLLAAWKEAVGERVSQHTEAIKIRNQVLYVSTSSPAWAQELTFLKEELIKKFNIRTGKENIRDIKFSAGG
jgi:predicted nucleic acid-binding Zn ribbon protein